jgi:hypothetical protein
MISLKLSPASSSKKNASVQYAVHWNRWIFPMVAIISIRMGDIDQFMSWSMVGVLAQGSGFG